MQLFVVKDIVPNLKQAKQMAQSVTSYQQRQVQKEQKQINGRAGVQEAIIDNKKRDLEQEVVDNAKLIRNNTILAVKARSKRAMVRQEFDRRRFEVGAALRELLSQIEDDFANDMGSAHSLDAISIGNWVVTNSNINQPASGPDSTNVSEPVMTNVDSCTWPSVTTTLVAAGDYN